jgi:hypothetical protein
MIDFAADGGAMSWRSSAGQGDAFYRVDPYLIELGWRAWDCMGEENIPRANGIPGSLGQFLGGWAGRVTPVTLPDILFLSDEHGRQLAVRRTRSPFHPTFQSMAWDGLLTLPGRENDP